MEELTEAIAQLDDENGECTEDTDSNKNDDHQDNEVISESLEEDVTVGEAVEQLGSPVDCEQPSSDNKEQTVNSICVLF